MALGLGSEKEENNTTWAHTTSTNYATQVNAAKQAAQAQLAAKKEKEAAAAAAEAAKQQAAQQQAQQQAQQSTVQTQQTTTPTSDSNNDYYDTLIELLSEQINSQKDYISSLEDKEAETLAAQKAAIQAGVDQSVNTLNNEKENVSTSYADTIRQLYIDKMNAQKNIGQQMAAAGQTGGQAESTLLGLNTDYAENLRQSEQAKSSALSELETAIANAKLSGSAEEASAIAESGQNSVSNYLTAMNNLIGNGTSVASLANTASTNAQSTAYEKAMTLLSSGVMPDSTTLSSAGISDTEATNLLAAVNAANKSSSSGSSKTETTLSEDEQNIILNALANGNTSEEVYNALKVMYPNLTPELVESVYAESTGETETSLDDGKYSVSDEAAMIYQQSGKDATLSYLKEMYTNRGLSTAQYRTLREKYS